MRSRAGHGRKRGRSTERLPTITAPGGVRRGRPRAHGWFHEDCRRIGRRAITFASRHIGACWPDKEALDLPQDLLGRASLDSPFAVLRKQLEVVFRDTVVFPQMPLDPVPESLDAVDISSTSP